MRRAWLLALACVLTAALIVLGALQVRWIDAVSAAEDAAARRAMEIAAKLFAEDVSRELARATLALQFATFDANELTRRYEEWSAGARDRRFLEALYVATPDGGLWQLDPPARALRAAAWPASLLPVRAALANGEDERIPAGVFSAIVLPLRPPQERAPRPGVLIAQINRAYLLEDFFPELARRAAGFDLAVVEEDKIIWRSQPDWPRSAVDRAELSMPFLMMRRVRGREREEIVEKTASPRLLLRRHGQTISEAVENGRRNNLMISFAILALLGGSFVLLAVLARRAERLRLQQLDFVAGITHELNTPLAALTSAGQNLVDGVVTDPAHVARYGEAIVKESRRLADLVAQVLEFAGLQARRKRVAQPVDVARVVNEAIAQCRWMAEEKGVRMEVDVPRDLPQVEGDAAALARAVQNLVANAIRHGGDGEWVGVRAASERGEIVISIEDRGAGVAARDLPHLFEPFYRGRGAERVRGSGLGLTIVKQIAAAHGGSVAVAARRERGAAFVLRLPELRHA